MALLKIEVDGEQVEVPGGTMVMEAANKLGIYIPHFCYHKKLSIAANCRMCLVDVEKAPKPLPACATPVTDGMKVWTHTDKAKQAQAGVMEFLLINHPLDCPICDQGGECQLQDLAVGYGGSSSRYMEPKRIVVHKDIGPLVAAEEMTRCIHCTRCIRFGQEIAGIQELGMINRGEHSEIVSFVGRSVESELSGNMIDLCPVGALTSKPFRYTARPWELARRKSVSPHDSLGSNLIVQVKQHRVMRILPRENEALNEVWLSDKDRFSYLALHDQQRLATPMVRDSDGWHEVDWERALERVVEGLRESVGQQGTGKSLGTLCSPHATLEELYLAAKLTRALGSENIDFRLRESDFRLDGRMRGAPWLGMKVAELGTLDRVLVIGSFLRKDAPLIAHRLRQAAKKGLKIHFVHCADDDQLMSIASKAIVAPDELPTVLAQIGQIVGKAKGAALMPASGTPTDEARAIGESLASGERVGILLGNAAIHHPRSSEIRLLSQWLAGALAARYGVIGEAANSVGGYIAQAVPRNGGLNAQSMLADPRSAYLLLNVEPDLDTYDAQLTARALRAARFVVALGMYRNQAADYAHVMLPITPFTETSGTFVNAEGLAQSFNGAALPYGQARPAWKVLRVLGTMLGLPGFDYAKSDTIRDEVLAGGDLQGRLDNTIEVAGEIAPRPIAGHGLQRIADVPIYFADPIVRRSIALQRTRDARVPRARMSSATIADQGLGGALKVRVTQGEGSVVLDLEVDETVPKGCVRVAAAHPATAALGPMFGSVEVEAVSLAATAEAA